ncbi:hypothetical protein CR513_46619, partial [Mucuna pruriens]
MASAAASDGFFRPIYEGCISGYDNDVERRPYHRNCGCALHSKSQNKACGHKMPRCNSVSYPMRRAWSEGSLFISASPHSSPSSSSPAAGPRSQLDEEGQHKLGVLFQNNPVRFRGFLINLVELDNLGSCNDANFTRISLGSVMLWITWFFTIVFLNLVWILIIDLKNCVYANRDSRRVLAESSTVTEADPHGTVRKDGMHFQMD